VQAVALNVDEFVIYAPAPDILNVLEFAVNVPVFWMYSVLFPSVMVHDADIVNVPELLIYAPVPEPVKLTAPPVNVKVPVFLIKFVEPLQVKVVVAPVTVPPFVSEQVLFIVNVEPALN
jgi:hypothetical protein